MRYGSSGTAVGLAPVERLEMPVECTLSHESHHTQVGGRGGVADQPEPSEQTDDHGASGNRPHKKGDPGHTLLLSGVRW